jgi:lipoprotein NlpD
MLIFKKTSFCFILLLSTVNLIGCVSENKAPVVSLIGKANLPGQAKPKLKPKLTVVLKPPLPLVTSNTSLPVKTAKTSVTILPKTTEQTVTTTVTEGTKWIWPVKGTILKRFSDTVKNKGLAISGNAGDPVKAARTGVVVYSGTGLRGYGKLIIIKHDENLLSAYAHNQELLVKEEERVTVGQVIAKMGSSGTDSVKLHFEIRYQGKPVDPLQYLPKP